MGSGSGFYLWVTMGRTYVVIGDVVHKHGYLCLAVIATEEETPPV
jgi:hypothetical protein